jgi:hypothetical protein
MSGEKPTPSQGNQLNDVLKGLREWRRQHPKATQAEIERETMRRMAQLQAQIMEGLSQTFPVEERQAEVETQFCPGYGAKMQRRGQSEHQLKGSGGQTIHLKRSFFMVLPCNNLYNYY